jgi:hypothetical protein
MTETSGQPSQTYRCRAALGSTARRSVRTTTIVCARDSRARVIWTALVDSTAVRVVSTAGVSTALASCRAALIVSTAEITSRTTRTIGAQFSRARRIRTT